MKDVILKFLEMGRVGTAMGEAARWGENAILKDLLDKGVPVDKQLDEGATALLMAASGANMSGMKLLLQHGANVNAQANDGRTALHYGLWAHHSDAVYREIVQTLVTAGADVSIASKDGLRPLDLASTRASDDVVAMLSKKGA